MNNLVPLNQIKQFLNSGLQLTKLPSKHAKKIIALQYLATKFEPNVSYTEKQVNEILVEWHTFEDWATLRRELFNAELIDRDKDCTNYRLPTPVNIIVYAHGFGVQKDSAGIFTDIQAAVPSYKHILIDLNDILPGNQLKVKPLGLQAELLNKELAKHDDNVILICHSMGCIVAGLADLSNVDNVLLLAPPTDIGAAEEQQTSKAGRKGAIYLDDGTLSFPRTDGSTTLIPASYWPSLQDIKPVSLYSQLASSVRKVTVIRATQDEILKDVSLKGLDQSISILDIATDHNFTNARAKLIASVKQIIN